MKLLKISQISFIVLLAFIFAFPAHAATTPPATKTSNIVVSKLNILNTQIDSQIDNTFKISFDVVNQSDAQTGLKYSALLMKSTKNSQIIADETVYPETLSISANSQIHKIIDYVVPTNLVGDYALLISLKNSSGLTLGLNKVVDIGFEVNPSPTVSNTTLQILQDTCSLRVMGEGNNISYNVAQGVDIATKEKLTLICSVKNPLKTDVSALPTYETHLRSMSGEIVSQQGGDLKPILFKGNETKTISLVLPKGTKPQAYDLEVALSSAGKVSNSIIAHYIIRGESATIQKLSLDKDYYAAKDNAKILISWSPSADGFIGNRLGKKTVINTSLKVNIVNDKNKDCISPITQILSTGGNLELNIPVKINCNNPIAAAELVGSSGNILDQKIFSTESKTPIAKSGLITITIIGVLIVVGLTVYFINLKKKGYTNSDLSKSNETTI